MSEGTRRRQAPSPMDSIEVGSRMRVSASQNWKVYPPMLMTFDPRVTESNVEHSIKAVSPMLTTLDPIVTESNLHCKNALVAMLVTVELIDMSPLQHALEGVAEFTQS